MPGQNDGLCGIEYLALHGDLGVGDPPNSGCCAYGAHMGAFEMELLEFWERIELKWYRLNALEGPLIDNNDDPLRRRAAIDYAIRIDKKEDYERCLANENVGELAALLTRAGHRLPDMAAAAAIKSLQFIRQRNERVCLT